jgi:hypothetical protein
MIFTRALQLRSVLYDHHVRQPYPSTLTQIKACSTFQGSNAPYASKVAAVGNFRIYSAGRHGVQAYWVSAFSPGFHLSLPDSAIGFIALPGLTFCLCLHGAASFGEFTEDFNISQYRWGDAVVLALYQFPQSFRSLPVNSTLSYLSALPYLSPFLCHFDPSPSFRSFSVISTAGRNLKMVKSHALSA